MELSCVILHSIVLRLYLIFFFHCLMLNVFFVAHNFIYVADELSLLLSWPITFMSDNAQLLGKSLAHAHILTLFLFVSINRSLRPLFIIGGRLAVGEFRFGF